MILSSSGLAVCTLFFSFYFSFIVCVCVYNLLFKAEYKNNIRNQRGRKPRPSEHSFFLGGVRSIFLNL